MHIRQIWSSKHELFQNEQHSLFHLAKCCSCQRKSWEVGYPQASAQPPTTVWSWAFHYWGDAASACSLQWLQWGKHTSSQHDNNRSILPINRTTTEKRCFLTWDNTVHYLLLATAISPQTQTTHWRRRSCARADTHLGWMRQSIGPAAPLPTCLSPWPHSPPLLGIQQTVCVWSCGESSPREGVRGGSGGPGCTSYARQRRTRWSWSPSGRKGGELKKEGWRRNDKGTRKN